MCDEWVIGLHFLTFGLMGAIGMLFILGFLGFFDKDD